MKGRGRIVAWGVVALVLVIGLVYEMGKWRALATEGARAAAERERLTKEIRSKEEQIVHEMRTNAALLQEMQWTSSGGDPSAFLTRFADLVAEKRMRITAIGALERAGTAQFNKSWHTVTVVAPFREVRELASRVEAEKGILEDMVLEIAKDQAPAARSASAPEEVQARFKMTALELTPDARKVFERSLAAAGPGGQSPAPAAPSLALPVPARVADPTSTRDPFEFGQTLPRTAAARPAPGGRPAATGATAGKAPASPDAAKADKPEVAFELRGIVSFPGGYLAIVNNQIVKVGDTVTGHRVERITDNSVALRNPDGGTRTVTLPDLVGGAPTAPRR
jgi:hypothetical protein